MSDLPLEIYNLAFLKPMEDVALYVLRQGIKSVPIYSLIPETLNDDQFILVRRDHAFGVWGGDPRGLDHGNIVIQTYTRDPDGDAKGAILSEAVRVVLNEAYLNNMYVPGHGWVARCRLVLEPSRKTDWATSAGPVQYADLPNGFWRYESKYSLLVRRER